VRKNLLLISIFVLAAVLRFWQLGINPPSLDWDEASLGYNGYSLLHTGKDEYGIKWPLSIKSFGDYKPPLYTYLTIPSIAAFGLNEFSTRLPAAVVGTIAVIAAYFLFVELFPEFRVLYSILFAFFFAVSPWHIQFSRIAFESNISVCLFIIGVLFFLKGMRKGLYFPFSFISFAFSIYAYHSPRLIVPLFLFLGSLLYLRPILKQWKWYVLGVILCTAMLLPLVISERATSAARFGSVTLLNANERLGPSIKAMESDRASGDIVGSFLHNRRIVFGREILAGYLDHFNIDFLFLNGDPPGRHHAVGMGMLYWWDFPFVIIGILYLLKYRSKGTQVVFLWFLLAPTAASLTSGTPHAVRAMLFLPVYQIFITTGVVVAIRYFNFRRIVTLGIGTLFIMNFFYYQHMYWIHSPVEYASEWQYGYKQAVEEVASIQDQYEHIVVTYRYDQPYIYFLFFQQIGPEWYQTNWGSGEIQRAQRSFGKYEFRNIDWVKDSQLTNILFVGTDKEIPAGTRGIIKEIKYPDGSVAFRIAAR
jgi:4-amino-4-deoxy-L-arabinose transferase-like glycosyltransferase